MSGHLFSIVNSFIDFAIFLAAAIFLIFPRPRKFKRDDIILISFWLIISVTFFLNGIQLALFVYKQAVITSMLMIKAMSVLMILFTGLGVYFLFSRLFTSKRIKRIVAGCLFLMLLFDLYFILFKTRMGIKFGEPRLEFPNQAMFSYLVGLFLFLFNILILTILRKEFQRGNISWDNLSLFYKIISVGIFGAVSFLRVLYFLPHPWYIRIFYLLIPYFNYLANKETRKQIHTN